MELGILVGHIKTAWEKQRKIVVEPHTSQGKFYESNLEAQKTLREMELLIKQLELFNQKQDVTLDHVKIITDFFEKRWERIKNTDLIYNIYTDSPVNTLCLYVARYLSEERDLVMKRNYLALLMPTIKTWRNEASHSDLWTLYLHNFIPADDNESCIQMGYVDLSIDESTSKLVMSYKVGGDRKYLSEKECDRVYHHSSVISDYYDLLRSSHKLSDSDKKKMHESITKARDSMVKALRDEQYGKRSVNASYRDAGRETLQKNLLKDPSHLFATREQLFDYMSVKLMPFEWRAFLTKMDENAEFLSLVLQDSPIDEITKLKSLFKKGSQYSDYNRVVAYCLVEAYWRQRETEGHYTSYTAYAGSLFQYAYPKEAKEKVVDIMRQFLTSSEKDGGDARKYFLPLQKDGADQARFSEDEHALLNAMRNSKVGKIHECICEFLMPAATIANDGQVSAQVLVGK